MLSKSTGAVSEGSHTNMAASLEPCHHTGKPLTLSCVCVCVPVSDSKHRSNTVGVSYEALLSEGFLFSYDALHDHQMSRLDT